LIHKNTIANIYKLWLFYVQSIPNVLSTFNSNLMVKENISLKKLRRTEL